ncbi:MAG: major capsid protein [Microviridae sp.]|nr:MAG: major capsid protein [Microviridae sp.]
MSKVTLGGNRLGSGNKQKVSMREYQRSSHDTSYIWRSTMASGTLVPFLSELALPGDSFDIDLNIDMLTHPTIGPLFGSWKIQLDVFQVPIRLYQGKLHQNMLGIGMDMSKVPLPQIQLFGVVPDQQKPIDNQQMNPSHLLSYLGIRGVGTNGDTVTAVADRKFNAIPYLGYWDIYKNYYANKQEEIGAMIHRPLTIPAPVFNDVALNNAAGRTTLAADPTAPLTYTTVQLDAGATLTLQGTNIQESTEISSLYLLMKIQNSEVEYPATQLFQSWQINNSGGSTGVIIGSNPPNPNVVIQIAGYTWKNIASQPNTDSEPIIQTFPLKAIDDMRGTLLSHLADTPYLITKATPAPYGYPIDNNGTTLTTQLFNQEGLALKTYNSDLFNNWISTEWIDGTDGISAVTAIDTSDGSFTIDELNLSKKIYDMLNRIALSGGSYDDWLDAVFTHDRQRSAENPMYLGGLIQNLVFQEVVSTAPTNDQPLGTLAGRGRLGSKKKGGHIIAKIDEPSYLIGIISLTPNIDYSQGNKWDTNLKTLNDVHKPALDEIGFQDLITDQMAWFDTLLKTGGGAELVPEFKSAGKQPAWINYMTNVNVVRGNFADQTDQMFMVLNRRYDTKYSAYPAGSPSIADVTTYIDPSKFNHIFAYTRRDAQNFWAQIGVNIEARRKMSAKVIPNL